MKVSTSIIIAKPKATVWPTITNIEQCENVISSIISIEVLEKPNNGLVGFKWKEVRKVFGKEASEIMWITDAVENEYYATRAESHGAIYISRLSLSETNGQTTLTMLFTGEAQTLLAKILSACMSYFVKGSLKKEMAKDLADIKAHIEAQ